MTGLIYKEWRQNRLYIIITAVCPVAAALITFLLSLIEGDNPLSSFTETDSMIFRALIALVGFLCAGSLQNLTLKGDDRKAWSIFISSTPEGKNGFLRVKYETVFVMIVIMFSGCIFFDRLLGAIVFDVTEQPMPDLSGVYLIFVSVQMFLRAIDLPFIIRFGEKRGGVIKMIAVIGLMIILIAIVFINPGNIVVNISKVIEPVFDGNNTSLLLNILPLVALAAYFISYKISCRIYLKGAEQYDK